MSQDGNARETSAEGAHQRPSTDDSMSHTASVRSFATPAFQVLADTRSVEGPALQFPVTQVSNPKGQKSVGLETTPTSQSLSTKLESLKPTSLQEGSFPSLDRLEAVPKYFAKPWSFFTHSSPATLLLHLSVIFAGMEGVDHLLKPSKCKINGYVNNTSGRCGFKVSLFRQQTNRMLCEFQRRSGCVIFFNKFWRTAISYLSAHSPKFVQPSLSSEATSECVHSLEPTDYRLDKPLPAMQVEAKVGADAETINQLFAMAASQSVDVQREGWAAMAAIAQTHSLVSALSRFLPMMEALLAENDSEISRFLCVLLAAVCLHEESRELVIARLLPRMLAVLLEPAHIANQDSKRHVARALFECSESETCRKAMWAQMDVFEKLEMTQDAVLKTSIAGTLRLLRDK